ncbi:IclR family transcriptional regulator [Hydrogenophaga sp. ANAO-22]|uniref:IclR family transcriptional regulator n=1 Tax=unclassified Hydrogenophaga TaxID=2610897 RepID=UPI0036D237DF
MAFIEEPRHQMYATSLANGMSVLAAFTAAEPALSNAALAKKTGLSRSTITRLTYTLTELRLLRFDTEVQQYRIGSAALSVAYPFLARLKIQHVALPLMQAFAHQQNVSVSLGMRSRDSMIYVENYRAFEGLEFRPDVGATLPLLRTAMGRAWLSAQPRATHAQALRELKRLQPRDWKRYRPALQEALASCASRGFCISHGDLHESIHAVAVPLRTRVDGESVVLNCGIPATILKPGLLERRIGPGLLALGHRIDAAMDALLAESQNSDEQT